MMCFSCDELGSDIPSEYVLQYQYGLQYHPRFGWYAYCVFEDFSLGMVCLTDEQALDRLLVSREELERIATEYVQADLLRRKAPCESG